MKVAVHNGDGTKNLFPNLALMKISAYHKLIGDSVEWFSALENYDRVYSSKVFSFTKRDLYLPDDVVTGGTGNNMFDSLPADIDSLAPDYTLYPDYNSALGFVTRGCVRACSWCVVPRKEGSIRFDRDILSVAGLRRHVVLMDNNFLAFDGCVDQLKKAYYHNLVLDFNQGLDARLVNCENAIYLAKNKWQRFIRFSCDVPEMCPVVDHAVKLIRSFGFRREFFCYVLVKDVESALSTVEFLRSIGVSPFAQAFIDYSGSDKRTDEQKCFCRWVNQKAVFNSVRWPDYRRAS